MSSAWESVEYKANLSCLNIDILAMRSDTVLYSRIVDAVVSGVIHKLYRRHWVKFLARIFKSGPADGDDFPGKSILRCQPLWY